MENERHYELRSRSRSRSQTPQVLSQNLLEPELIDHHYALRSKSRERSHTPGEVTSSRRSGSRSLPGSATKREKSMETISERKEENENELETQSGRSDSSMSTVVNKKPERRSERQKAKRQILANGQGDNKINESLEDNNRSADKSTRKSVTPQRILTSDYSSEEGEKEDVPSRPGSAYEIYKQAGDWWNVFRKTDYTYAQSSQCRYEIAPGVLAMPNMSRRSIHSDGSSIAGSTASLSQQNLSQRDSFGDSFEDRHKDSMDSNILLRSTDDTSDMLSLRKGDSTGQSTIYKRTHVEQYKSHKEVIYSDSGSSLFLDSSEGYSSWIKPSKYTTSSSSSRYRHISQVDSDTELDEAMTTTSTNRNVRKWEFTQSFFTIVTSFFTRIVELVTFGRYKSSRSTYQYRRYGVESKWNKIWSAIDHTLQYLYLLLVKILLLDSWLLSRATSVRDRVQKQRSKLLWIVLLPPLLLAGWLSLPYFLSIVPSFASFQNVTTYFNRNTENLSQVSTHSAPYVSISRKCDVEKNEAKNDVKDEELKLMVELLEKRILKLETGGVKDSGQLANATLVWEKIEERGDAVLKHHDSKFGKFEEKLSQLETNCENSSGDINNLKIEFQTLRQLFSQSKSCCDVSKQSTNNEDMEKHIESALSGYFGSTVSKTDLAKIIEGLRNVNARIEQLENGFAKDSVVQTAPTQNEGQNLSDEDMRKIVKEIIRVYDADKTGRVDYALESAGGQVISTRCTQRYNIKTRAFKLLGFTMFYESNNPRTVIQGNSVQPGACWAFQDFPGYLLIKLRNAIYVTGFSLEHASKLILPNGEMKSAPKKFNVWGLKDENDVEPVMFGDYEFQNTDDSLQYFPVQNTSITEPYEYVELRIHSNHGQLEYTCLYRFRVHGRPV